VDLWEPFGPCWRDIAGQAVGLGSPRGITADGKDFQVNPVGSGPYAVVSWTRGNEVRLRANPDYYGGKPKIGEVVYKIIPDSNTLATQVQTHEIAIAWNLPPAQYGRVQSVAGVTTIAPVVYVFDHLDFNLTRPLFADVRVRRALTYALDRPGMLEKVQHNLGELSPTFLDPSLYPDAYDPTVMKYPYDPARARALLDEAGWKVGKDGIRVKNGERLSFELSTQIESTTGHLVQTQAQVFWHAIGAEAVIKNYPGSLFFDQTMNGVLAGGRYDVALYAFAYNNIDPAREQVLTPAGFPPDGTNVNFYDNPRVTQLENAGVVTFDPAKRNPIYDRVQQLVAQDLPFVTLSCASIFVRRRASSSPR